MSYKFTTAAGLKIWSYEISYNKPLSCDFYAEKKTAFEAIALYTMTRKQRSGRNLHCEAFITIETDFVYILAHYEVGNNY